MIVRLFEFLGYTPDLCNSFEFISLTQRLLVAQYLNDFSQSSKLCLHLPGAPRLGGKS